MQEELHKKFMSKLDGLDEKGGKYKRVMTDQDIIEYFKEERKLCNQLCMIAPNVYLGSIIEASHLQLLKDTGITHIVNASDYSNLFPNDFKYLRIDIKDEEDVNILDQIEKTNLFIKDAIKNGKVYVHCYRGLSRSVSIIIGYLMSSNGLTFEQSKQLIMKTRHIAPNNGFVKQLNYYEKRLKL